MDKLKVIVVVSCAVAVLVLGIVLLRWMQGLFSSAAQDLRPSEGTPAAEGSADEGWVAPEIPILDDAPPSAVPEPIAKASAPSAPPTQDDELVPVDETAAQLANTVAAEMILDENMNAAASVPPA